MYCIKIKIMVRILFSKGKKAPLAKKKQENCRTDTVENRSQKQKPDGLSQDCIAIAKKGWEREEKGGKCRFLLRIFIRYTLPLLGNAKAKQCQISAKAIVKSRILIEIGYIQTKIHQAKKEEGKNAKKQVPHLRRKTFSEQRKT